MFMCASTAISVPLRSYLPWMALRGAVTSGAVPAAVGHRLCRTRSRTQAEPVVVAAGGSLSPPPQKQRFGSLQERQREETPPLLTGTVLLSPEREHWWQRWRCASSSAVSSSSSETWQARDVPAKKACWWLGKRQLLCFPPPRAPQTAWCPALDSNRGTGGGQQDGSGRARTRGASSTRSKGPQLVTSARKPLMPRPGAGRFTPGTHFPFPSQKSCVNLTFKKLCLIPFYSFSSLANCSAFFCYFFVFFWIRSDFVICSLLCEISSFRVYYLLSRRMGKEEGALAVCVCCSFWELRWHCPIPVDPDTMFQRLLPLVLEVMGAVADKSASSAALQVCRPACVLLSCSFGTEKCNKNSKCPRVSLSFFPL